MKKIVYGAAVFAALFFVGCSGENPEQAQEQVTTTEVESDVNEENAPEFFLPSALQIGSVFQRSGLGYVEGIVLNTNNVTTFTSKTEKLLGLGLYSADLSYAVLNNQSQQAINTLKAVRQLSEEVGLNEVFSSAELITRFEKNLGYQDSILDIIITIQEKTDNYFDENGLKNIAVAVFTGAWVEGMYMGVKATSGEDREKITMRLVEQMVIMDNLIIALDFYYKNDPVMTGVIAQLKEIQTYFNNIEVIKNRNEVAIKDLKINYSDIKQMADKLVTLRTKIAKLNG